MKKGRERGDRKEERPSCFLLPSEATRTSEGCAEGHPTSMDAKQRCLYARTKNQAKICSFFSFFKKKIAQIKVRLTLPKMCLVSGDQENLSSMPRGMKIISQLQDMEWKQRPDGFGSADMCNSLQYGERHDVMLTGHINISQPPRPPQKKPLFSSGTRGLRPVHGHTLGEEKALELLYGNTISHRQRLPPALWWHAGRTDARVQRKIREIAVMWIHKCGHSKHADTHLEVERWLV